jgi:hypothetical protein
MTESRLFAAELEAGRLNKRALLTANRHVIECGREWNYAVGQLARHHRVSVPRWFLKENCRLQRSA